MTTSPHDGTPTPWPHDDPCHGYWVEPGRILAGEYPGAREPEVARRKLELLVDAGVGTFVDLTEEGELVPYDDILASLTGSLGVEARHVRCAIPDMSVIDDTGYDAIVATIREATSQGVVYVHCWGGIGRTATVVGCLLVDDGLSAPEAFARIDELRAPTRKAHRPAPQTPAQRTVIERRAQAR